MQQRPDWLRVPPSLVDEMPRHLGGRRLERDDLLVHRTLLPILPIEQHDQLLAANPGVEVEPVSSPLLRPYQRIAADFARSRVGSLLALDCGLGKTRTALAAVDEGPEQLGVIVAPKIAFGVWQKELALFGYGVTILRGRKLSEMADFRAPGVYLMNPEIVRARWSEWSGRRVSWVIYDEAHLYARSRANRSEGAHALTNLARRRVALTGTPILRHTMDLHSILTAVSPSAFGSWATMANWLGYRRDGHRWILGAVKEEFVPLLEARLSEIMIRQRWVDVAEDVPPITREPLHVELAADDRRRYDRLAQDARVALEEHEIPAENLTAAAQLVQVAELRRFVGRAKVGPVADFVAGLDEPVVVWAWHRDVVATLTARLGTAGVKALALTGEMKDADRQSVVRRFQSGDADVLVATIAVAGVGIDLSRARLTVYAELSWVPAEMQQSEARVFRSGQTRPCVTYWALVEGSVEDRVLEVLRRKIGHWDTDTTPAGVQIRRGLDNAVTLISDAVASGEEY